MKLNYEKYMKKLYALINACEAPACISEEMADDIYEDVADTEAENKTLRHDLSEERKTTKTLSVALAEIYRTVYGYEPSALFPLEGTLENIQKQIENMKRRSKAFSGSLVGPSKEESTIKYLEQCIRHIHSKLKCPDSDVKDLEAVLEEIHVRISSLLTLMKSGFEEINVAESKEDEVPKIELEEFIEKLHKAVYGEPAFAIKELKTHFLHRLITIIQRDKEERGKCAKLENEIARLKYETSNLRFAENGALEKKAEVWAIKAIGYRMMLGAVARRLRDKADSLSINDIKDLADIIKREIEK